MISIWWLPLIVFLSVIVGLSITAITSASNFADLHEKILQKNRIIADQKNLLDSTKKDIVELHKMNSEMINANNIL